MSQLNTMGDTWMAGSARKHANPGDRIPTPNFPPRPARIIGRDAEIRAVAEHLSSRRFVTIRGPAGIGKTTLAVALAYELGYQFRDGIAFLNIASLKDPHQVVSAAASVLGLNPSGRRSHFSAARITPRPTTFVCARQLRARPGGGRLARRANLPMHPERLHPGNKPRIPSGGRRVRVQTRPARNSAAGPLSRSRTLKRACGRQRSSFPATCAASRTAGTEDHVRSLRADTVADLRTHRSEDEVKDVDAA
jgi:Novel STAND NTPase 3